MTIDELEESRRGKVTKSESESECGSGVQKKTKVLQEREIALTTGMRKVLAMMQGKGQEKGKEKEKKNKKKKKISLLAGTKTISSYFSKAAAHGVNQRVDRGK